jgi:opacity protein-like surface antigen
VIHPSGRQPSDPPWFRRRPGSPAGRRPGTTGWTPGSARSCSGFGLSLCYHFLSFSRVVPYVELFGAAGGTDLKRPEIDSRFTFLLHGGVGASVFVTDVVAIYAGYRLQHVSNGNTSRPNHGFESHTGIAGVSWVFP